MWPKSHRIRSPEWGRHLAGALTVFPWAEWGFYILTLVFAAVTTALLLLSCLRPQIFQSRRLTVLTFAIGGTLSLFLVSDFSWLFLGFWAHKVWSWFGGSDDALVAVAVAAAILVLASLLHSKFLRTQRWAIYLLGIGGAVSLLLLTNFYTSWVSSRTLLEPEICVRMLTCLSCLYWIVPAVLWYRLGLSGRSEMKAQWIAMRSRVMQMYVPLVVTDCIFLVLVVKDGVWGFLVFFMGLHLLSLGYMQLARNATPCTSVGEGGG